MACEECVGGHRGPLPGMVCPRCGGVDPEPPSRGSRAWIVFAVLAVGAGCLVAVVTLSGGEAPPPAAGEPPVRTLPTRIGPTEFPGEPSRTPSTSAPARTSPPVSGAPAPTHPSRDPSGSSGPPSYTVWAGPGCTGGDYHETGRYADGFEGWYTVTRGGYRGGGCDGRFSAMPMSGSPTEDHDNSATWTWHVSPDYTNCELSVHIPYPPRPADAAGNPSVYELLDRGTPYAAFTLDQTAHPGELLRAGNYTLRTTVFTVRLLDRGQDWGSSSLEHAHHAAGQMRLTCRR